MAEIKHGVVTLEVADHLVPPAEAGNLTAEALNKLRKARLGVGLACEAAATSIERAGET